MKKGDIFHYSDMRIFVYTGEGASISSMLMEKVFDKHNYGLGVSGSWKTVSTGDFGHDPNRHNVKRIVFANYFEIPEQNREKYMNMLMSEDESTRNFAIEILKHEYCSKLPI